MLKTTVLVAIIIIFSFAAISVLVAILIDFMLKNVPELPGDFDEAQYPKEEDQN